MSIGRPLGSGRGAGGRPVIEVRRKCPVCSRMVARRSNGKLYRHNRHEPKAFGRRPVKGFMCEGTGRKVGR